ELRSRSAKKVFLRGILRIFVGQGWSGWLEVCSIIAGVVAGAGGGRYSRVGTYELSDCTRTFGAQLVCSTIRGLRRLRAFAPSERGEAIYYMTVAASKVPVANSRGAGAKRLSLAVI